MKEGHRQDKTRDGQAVKGIRTPRRKGEVTFYTVQSATSLTTRSASPQLFDFIFPLLWAVSPYLESITSGSTHPFLVFPLQAG